jgi:hypothetical protein
VQRDVGPLVHLAKFQNRGVGLRLERPDVGRMRGEQSSDVSRATVPGSKPHHLGWCAAEKAEPVKISVFRDQDTAVFTRHLPHVRIGRTAAIEQPNVEGAWKHVDQLPNQHLRQLFVEEQTHGSDRDADCSALALGGIGQARANVILRELGEVGQQFSL